MRASWAPSSVGEIVKVEKFRAFCPAGLDIPTIFTFEGYLKRYNLAEWAKDRYMNLKKRAKDCLECGECEKRCPYELKIRERLKNVAREFEDAEKAFSDSERS